MYQTKVIVFIINREQLFVEQPRAGVKNAARIADPAFGFDHLNNFEWFLNWEFKLWHLH